MSWLSSAWKDVSHDVSSIYGRNRWIQYALPAAAAAVAAPFIAPELGLSLGGAEAGAAATEAGTAATEAGAASLGGGAAADTAASLGGGLAGVTAEGTPGVADALAGGGGATDALAGGGAPTDALAYSGAATPGSSGVDAINAAAGPGQGLNPSAANAISGNNALDQLAINQSVTQAGATTPGAAASAPVDLSAGASTALGGPSDVTAGKDQFGSPSPTTTNAGTSTGFFKDLSAGNLLKIGAEAAPLAMLGMTVARGQPNLPPAEQQSVNTVAGPNAPEQALANTELTSAATNTITPAQQQQIDTWVQQQKNQLYQQYASMGQDPNQNSGYILGLQNIDQQAVSMHQQFIDSAITAGLNAQGGVNSVLNNAAQLQVQQDQAYQDSIKSAMQSFGLVSAINAKGA